MLSRRHWLMLLPLLALRWLLRPLFKSAPSPGHIEPEHENLGYQAGDQPERAHASLRDSQPPMAWRSLPTEQTRCIVVGGGLSGLIGAESLAPHPCVLLEMAQTWGGHSQSVQLNHHPVSLAAAYINTPIPSSPSYVFLQRLKLVEQAKAVPHPMGSWYRQGQRWRHLWTDTSPEDRRYLQELEAYLGQQQTLSDALPPSTLGQLDMLCQLDANSLFQHVQHALGNMSPWCKSWLDAYCLSTFAGRSDDISAAQGLAFLSADHAGISVFPGGNGSITTALLKRLQQQSHTTLKSGCMVRAIEVFDHHVDVLYHNDQQELQRLRAPTCLLAIPKFIAKRLVHGLPQHQRHAMAQIQYKAYLVINVQTNQSLKMPTYDGLWLEEPQEPLMIQDIVDTQFALPRQQPSSTYTLYCPMPKDHHRHLLLQPDYPVQLRQSIARQLAGAFGLTEPQFTQQSQIHLTRWGHALPLPAPGLLAQGVLPLAHQSFQNKLFFSQQDNWCAPGFEVVLAESVAQARKITQVL